MRSRFLRRCRSPRASLREKQQVEATPQIGPSGTVRRKVQLEVGVEFYFEEGELLVPLTFDPTNAEKEKAGA